MLVVGFNQDFVIEIDRDPGAFLMFYPGDFPAVVNLTMRMMAVGAKIVMHKTGFIFEMHEVGAVGDGDAALQILPGIFLFVFIHFCSGLFNNAVAGDLFPVGVARFFKPYLCKHGFYDDKVIEFHRYKC